MIPSVLVTLITALFVQGESQARRRPVGIKADYFYIRGEILPAGEAVLTLIMNMMDESAFRWLEAKTNQEALDASNRIARSLGLDPEASVFMWDEILINREYRGHGLGKKIIHIVAHQAKISGIQAIIGQAGILDWKEQDEHSLGFWRKMGVKEVPGTQFFDDVIVYHKLG